MRNMQHDISDVSIVNERLVLTQSDMDRSNFGVDTEGRSVILDCGEIGWLPESLELFTLFRTTGFASSVAEHLYTPEDAATLRKRPNLHAMAGVKVLLGVASRPSLSESTHRP